MSGVFAPLAFVFVFTSLMPRWAPTNSSAKAVSLRPQREEVFTNEDSESTTAHTSRVISALAFDRCAAHQLEQSPHSYTSGSF